MVIIFSFDHMTGENSPGDVKEFQTFDTSVCHGHKETPRSIGPGSSPGWGHHIVLLCKTYSQGCINEGQ